MAQDRIMCDCGHLESEHSEHTRGYGRDEQGKTYCYACCAERDREQMRKDGRTTLYLVKETRNGLHLHKLTNWPGSLEIGVNYYRRGHHNIARTRYDVWFTFEGDEWHGVQYGEMTQICHCRRLKKKSA